MKVAIKTLNEEEYVYVNPKQYMRILRRRELRKKYQLKSKENKPKYLHESRHKHAVNRQRGKGGRFIGKNELKKDFKLEEQENSPQ
jgi:nuclear transcription factor Y alpha